MSIIPVIYHALSTIHQSLDAYEAFVHEEGFEKAFDLSIILFVSIDYYSTASIGGIIKL